MSLSTPNKPIFIRNIERYFLLKFLLKKECYLQYITNIHCDKSAFSHANISRLRDAFLQAFGWGTTPQGYNIWENINNTFLKDLAKSNILTTKRPNKYIYFSK